MDRLIARDCVHLRCEGEGKDKIQFQDYGEV